ncbi:EpsG family protein [Jeotgalibacillus aurantiacus]|uniref:EpsG family protein n=1 Tax=Jeotgalibacillus aurantiacus TaxID=2763266 RepID=UPI001D0A0BB7|nr:EpsG family protein [Jeotgalibacillus aurantiacus]
MTIFWLTLASVFILGFFARYAAVPAGGIHYTPVPVIPNRFLIAIAALILALVSGLRSNIGDTFNYKDIYERNDFTWEYIFSEKDYGFGILQRYLKLLSEDPQILLFTTGIITNILIVLILFKYSRMIEISLFVYITGGFYLVSMNGIRQTLAAAIMFTATKFLIERRFLPYALIIVFASFFHQTALVMLPIYFIVGARAWSKATVGLILIAVVIVFSFEQFTSILFTAIEDTQYADYKEFNEGGANMLRVAVALPPLIIAYLGRGKLKKIMPGSDVIINMTLLGLVFLIVSTQSWIFARFSLYFSLYQLILLSWVIKLFREKDEKLIYYLILICYLFYYYYENVVSLNIIYKSDYLIF